MIIQSLAARDVYDEQSPLVSIYVRDMINGV